MCLPCTKQRVITCKTCGVTGHNSRTCKKSLGVPQSEKRAAAALLKILDLKPRVITCKTCGLTGHNSRTCGKSPKIPQSETRAAKSLAALLGPVNRVITCKTCGVTGHNSRTCGKPSKEEKVKQVSLQGVTMFKEPKAYYTGKVSKRISSTKAPRGITCKGCGEVGHNSRTCPLIPRPCPTTSPSKKSGRKAATKNLEDNLIEDFNPKVDDMRKYLLEQCKVWGIETK